MCNHLSLLSCGVCLRIVTVLNKFSSTDFPPFLCNFLFNLDDLKEKVEAKFNELGDLCEKGELEPEEAYNQFKKYEDEVVMEYGKMMEAEAPTFDETDVQDNKKDLDDPPGEGPILRWQTRVVFAPGGDAWHPKNRKVKLSVTVKELGLSKYQFRRLRELVGKRYHPGKDELTITSER